MYDDDDDNPLLDSYASLDNEPSLIRSHPGDSVEDLWKELTQPRVLEGSLADGPPLTEQQLDAEARDAQAMLGEIVLNRFRVDKFLDHGSVGRIYRGTQLSLGRPVAIKVLRPMEGPRAEVARKRFVREAKFLEAMRHRNVVELIDSGETDYGDPVMVMELLEGHTIKEHLDKRGPFPAKRVIRIAMQLARAMGRAHELGGVHRDLKPANVFLERDDQDRDLVKVLDFGLVKPSGHRAKQSASITLSGYVLGTPFYMSPEQAMGEALDARSDIYSLGVMMFELLAGAPPFSGDSVATILAQHIDHPVPKLAAVYPRVECPPALEELIHQLMGKEPVDRPDSMASIVISLKRIKKDMLARPQEKAALDAYLAGWDPEGKTSDLVDPAERSDPIATPLIAPDEPGLLAPPIIPQVRKSGAHALPNDFLPPEIGPSRSEEVPLVVPRPSTSSSAPLLAELSEAPTAQMEAHKRASPMSTADLGPAKTTNRRVYMFAAGIIMLLLAVGMIFWVQSQSSATAGPHTQLETSVSKPG